MESDALQKVCTGCFFELEFPRKFFKISNIILWRGHCRYAAEPYRAFRWRVRWWGACDCEVPQVLGGHDSCCCPARGGAGTWAPVPRKDGSEDSLRLVRWLPAWRWRRCPERARLENSKTLAGIVKKRAPGLQMGFSYGFTWNKRKN